MKNQYYISINVSTVALDGQKDQQSSKLYHYAIDAFGHKNIEILTVYSIRFCTYTILGLTDKVNNTVDFYEEYLNKIFNKQTFVKKVDKDWE